jgi:F-type H+-transporting ATPase subunit gamma
MATEKQIFTQMVSTKNISKITSSMKMVSAAKLKGDENRLAVARPFNEWTYAINGPPVYVEGSTFDDLPQKTLVVPLTSDKGLCGGVNTFINKSAKIVVAAAAKSGKEVDFVIVGDKGRAQMRRAFADNIKRSATDVVSPGTYALAGALAEEVAAAGAADYDAVMIIYNSYVNAAVYKQMYKMIKPMNGEGDDEPMMEYEFEPETKSEILADLYEYSLTSQLFHSFMDGAAAEQSSRMTAMSNATANANEMISSLTLRYNRARQARITTDLIEIISGAAALEEK